MTSAESARAQLVARLRRLHTASLHQALLDLGLPRQCLHIGIKPLERGMRIAGPAFTIAYTSDQSGEDNTVPAPNLEFFARMYRGCVVVVATDGDSVLGHWSDLSSIASQARGAAGDVVDGGVRDGNILMGMANWPVFARYLSPMGPEGSAHIHATEETVQLRGAGGEGVLVQPGDWIVGDMDGVVAIPAAVVEEAVTMAEAVEWANEQIRTHLSTGADAAEVFARHGRLR